MKIYNENLTQELENPDLTKGFLRTVSKLDRVVPFDPGTDDIVKQVEKLDGNGEPYTEVTLIERGRLPVPEHNVYESVQVYVPFNEQQLKDYELNQLKSWFEWYDNQVSQALRDARLNLVWSVTKDGETYTAIEQLDEIARTKQLRIRELLI